MGNSINKLDTTQNNPSQINLKVGNNSNIQFQNGVINSNQKMEVKEQSNAELLKFVHELRTGMDVLKKYLKEDEIQELKLASDYLEKNLKKEDPDKTIIKAVKGNILDIIKAVPANVIETIYTGFIQNFFT